MKKEIIINATLNEVRIAITEDGRLAEFFIDMPDNEKSIGNIYLGRVNKVIQGINAAFVSIGQEQDAFLHFSDLDESLENVITDEDDEEKQHADTPDSKQSRTGSSAMPKAKSKDNKKSKNIPKKDKFKNKKEYLDGTVINSNSSEESPVDILIGSTVDVIQSPTPPEDLSNAQESNIDNNSSVTPSEITEIKKNPKKFYSKNNPLRINESSLSEQTSPIEDLPLVVDKMIDSGKATSDKKSTNKRKSNNRNRQKPKKVGNNSVEIETIVVNEIIDPLNIIVDHSSHINDIEHQNINTNKIESKPTKRKKKPTKTKKISKATETDLPKTQVVDNQESSDNKKVTPKAPKTKKSRPKRIKPNAKENLDKSEPKNIAAAKKNSLKTSIALRTVKNEPSSDQKLATFKTKKHGELQINLEPGQDVIVQVVREAYGNKGVKVTSKIGIPGRYVVLLPFDNLIGVSKKIASYQERRRLRQIAKSAMPESYGLIIRTAAQDKSEHELSKDLKSLVTIWKEIEAKVKQSKSPQLVYQDMHVAMSVVRDLFDSDVKRVVVDSKKLYKEITAYLKWASPQLLEKVELYTEKNPIFDTYGIEKELANTYKRSLYLPSGGSIVIDQTEAMFVIDVNSGRSISDSQQEDNALNTNLEAAKEIARQVRLRDIAGIILIDFIDMNLHSNQRMLFAEMKRELARDRAKSVCYPLTQLNLMQITRQRINQNITEKLSEDCPTCNGTGRIISKGVLLNSIERWLKNFRTGSREFRLTIMVHPHIAEYLTEGHISKLSRMMIKYFVKINLQLSNHLRVDEFRFISNRKQTDITQDFI